MRRLCLLLLVGTMLTLPALAQEADMQILHFNDVYEIEPVDGGANGGAARIATLIQERASNDPLVLFSGDTLSPSLMSTIFKGSQMIDIYNQLGLDYAVFGNHEFDYGPEVAAERVAESDFPWLSTNLLDQRNGEPLAGGVHSELVEWNGVQVGLIGLIGDWFDLTSVGPNAQYVDYVTSGRTAARELKAQGAEFVIALTHMFQADDERLAREVPEIDLILGGHDHDPMTGVFNDTLVWKTGSDFRLLGQLNVYLGSSFKPLVIPRFLSVDASVAEDPSLQAAVAEYVAALDTQLGEPVGETTVVLDATRTTVRSVESNFGNLIADAMREYANTDVAIANGGGIRTDASYGPGVLTKRDLQAVQPFGNVIVSVRVTGAQLKEALENGVSQVEDGAGRFPHVSGMTMVYDPSRPAGDRVLEVEVGGKALDPAANYTLAVNNFVAEGGDGYDVLIGAPTIIDESGGRLDSAVLMEYVERHSPVSPQVEGRVTTP